MEKLVRKARRGDPDAFEKLIRLHMQSLYKVARAYLSSDEDAADAVQETIMACFEKLHFLKNDSYFKTWMIKILMRKCCDILRNKKVIDFSKEIREQPVQDRGFEELEWKEVIRLLDEKYRVIMVLYYVEGFRTGEIAQILEMNENTVRTRLKRGREELREIFSSDAERRQLYGTGKNVDRKTAGRGRNSGSRLSES